MQRTALLAVLMVCAAPLLLTVGGTDESASAGDTAAAAGSRSSDRVRLPIGQYNMDDYVARTGAEITFSESPWAKWGGEPVELSIVDDYTFSLSFAKPYGLFLSELTGRAPGHFMRPAHYMKQFHTAYTDIEDIEGVMKEQGYSAEEWGKFYNSYDVPSQTAASYVPTRYPNAIEAPSLHPWNVVDEPNPSEFILERNPYFYKIDPTGKQLPYIDRGHRIFVTDLEVMTAKIVAGETDLQFQFIRLGDFPLFKSNEDKGGYRTLALPAWQDQLLIYFASLTPEDQVYAEIVQDKRFRQAVSMAIDRTESQAENVWVIGTVAAAPAPFVYNAKLGNIENAEEEGYYSVVVGDAAEQWFWKE